MSFDKLRPPRVIGDHSQPTCDDDNACENVILSREAGDRLMMMKLHADEVERNGDRPTALRMRAEMRAQLKIEKDAAREVARRRPTNAGAPASQNGDVAMGCQCNQKRDAMEREIEARKKMIADSAAAYRTPGANTDDEQPTTPTNDAATAGMNREQRARAEMQRASRDASKRGN